MDVRVRLPAALYRIAAQQAADQGVCLDEIVRSLLALYTSGDLDPLAKDPIGSAASRRAAKIQQERRSPEERQALGRRLAAARWER